MPTRKKMPSSWFKTNPQVRHSMKTCGFSLLNGILSQGMTDEEYETIRWEGEGGSVRRTDGRPIKLQRRAKMQCSLGVLNMPKIELISQNVKGAASW